MGSRHPNPRLAKIHRSYSVEDIARLFDVHKNTIRSWLKQGLAAIDDRRPTLILGRELLRFLHERRQRAKQSCGPGRICIACRAPKVPAWKMADFSPTSPLAGNLCGICPDCHRLIYNNASRAATERCGKRWLRAGRRVTRIWPELGCDDLNDELLEGYNGT